MARLKVSGRVAVSAFAVIVLAVSACSGAPGTPVVTQPGVPGATQTPDGVEPTEPSVVPGGWSGTISFHLVRDIDTTESSTSGEGLYETTVTTTFELQSDVTDTFTVTGSDPEDLEFGIGSVDLAGQAANSGTTFERSVSVSDKRNALGCHYLAEIGSEIDGSWTLGGNASGEIDFSDDGTYRINIFGGDAGEDPLDALMWETFTILEGAATDCPPPGRSEVTGFGQYGEWAYSYGPGTLEGTLNTGDPGSMLDGSATVETSPLEGTVTATWHLVHDGPIVLPHE